MRRRMPVLAALVAASCAQATSPPRAPTNPPPQTPFTSTPQPRSKPLSVRSLVYPQTPIRQVVETLHGVTVADPYRWLEDARTPEVQRWMQAQDDLTRRTIGDLAS